MAARAVYGADDVHDFARRSILDALTLGPEDRLLDVGRGKEGPNRRDGTSVA